MRRVEWTVFPDYINAEWFAIGRVGKSAGWAFSGSSYGSFAAWLGDCRILTINGRDRKPLGRRIVKERGRRMGLPVKRGQNCLVRPKWRLYNAPSSCVALGVEMLGMGDAVTFDSCVRLP